MAKMLSRGDIIIGNDVWIGQNATILPGVYIGDGVMIGINSVVRSNVELYNYCRQFCKTNQKNALMMN